MISRHSKENIVETDILCNRGNANNTLSYFKECSANINNDNRDISNNNIDEEHNDNKLGSGEALPLGAWHWVGNTESLHSVHGVWYDRGWLVIFTHNPAI